MPAKPRSHPDPPHHGPSSNGRAVSAPGADSRCRVLVTGGAGFIGSHLVGLLLEAGQHVTVIDDLSTGRRGNLPAEHPRLTLLTGDLVEVLGALEGGALAGAPARFEQVYHLAAAVGVRLVVEEPIRTIETNVIATARLLEFALRHGPEAGGGGRGAATLIASSSEVYGKADKSPFSEEDDVVYGPTTRWRWSYAATKAIDEYMALAYHARHGLPVVVTRFFNTVGPRQVGSYGMVLPNFVAAALRGEEITVHGDGRQTRCFCDVRDVAPALVRLLETPACHGRVFNVGSDRRITIDDLADLVIKTLGSSSVKRRVPYEQAYASPGFEDLRRREPDLARIRAAIGFRAEIALERSILDIAAQMRSEWAAAAAGKVGVRARTEGEP